MTAKKVGIVLFFLLFAAPMAAIGLLQVYGGAIIFAHFYKSHKERQKVIRYEFDSCAVDKAIECDGAKEMQD